MMELSDACSGDDRPHLVKAEAVRRRILREMSAAQRIDAAMDMYWIAREQKTSALRRQNPGWTEGQIQRAVHEAILYARD